MFRYLLAMGSNVGDRASHFDWALARLHSTRLEILRQTSRVVTAPLPSDSHDVSMHEDYLNMVCEVRSLDAPAALYELIVALEDARGHPRDVAWQPRALDIDILLCALEMEAPGGDSGSQGGARDERQSVAPFSSCLPLVFSQGTLRIPHTGLASRTFFIDFLLQEMGLSEKDLAAHCVVPRFGVTRGRPPPGASTRSE